MTKEIKDKNSPVRQFLDQRFTSGLRDVQRRFRASAPALAIPSVPASAANPGTIGGAADWMLRFLVCPSPDATLALFGAGRHLGPRMMRATGALAKEAGATYRPYVGPVATPDSQDVIEMAQMPPDLLTPGGAAHARPSFGSTLTYNGSVSGSTLDSELLAPEFVKVFESSGC